MTEAKIVVSAEDKTRGAIESAQRNLRGLGDQASAVAGKFASIAAVAATAFAALGSARSAVNALDTLDDLAEKTGIAVESLAALRYAGEVTGTPLEALATGARKLATNIVEAGNGSKEAAGLFRAMGINVKDASGAIKTQDRILLEIADKFKGYEDGAAKADLAQRLFGKSGAAMIPLLNQGSSGIERLRMEAQQLGVIYGGDLAKQGAEFNDNLRKIGLSAEAGGAVIAGKLLPSVNELAKAWLEMRAGGGNPLAELVGDALLAGLQTVAILGLDVAFVFKTIGRDIGAVAAHAQALAKLDFSGAAAIREAYKQDTERARTELDALQRRIMTASQRAAIVAADGGGAWGRETRGSGGRLAAPPQLGGDDDDRAKRAAQDREKKERQRIIAEMNGLSGSFAEDWARLTAMYKDREITLKDLESAQAALLAKQPAIRAAADAEKKQQEEAVKQQQELSKVRSAAAAIHDKYIAGLAAENESRSLSVRGIAQEIEEMGLNSEALERLRLSRLNANIAREQEILLQARSIEGNDAEVRQIERRIELLQKERDLTVTRASKRVQVETKQFGDQAREDIYQATSAGLAQALREGRNPIKGFADALGNAVLDKVSRSLADALLDPILGKNGIFSVGISSFFSAMKFADGGIMTSAGAVPLRKYAAGGVANSPQLALYGEGSRPEAYVPLPDGRRIPVAMQGGAGGGDSITIVQNFTVGDVATQTTVQQAVAGSERRMVEAIERRQKYGGGR